MPWWGWLLISLGVVGWALLCWLLALIMRLELF
jgi:hypothetical protein